MSLLIFAILVLAGAGIVIGLVLSNQGKQFQPDRETQSDLTTVQTLYEKDGALQIHVDTRSSVMLRSGEVALFYSVPAAFAEEKSHTRHGGASIRIAKGVRIGGGESHSIPVVTQVDQGDLLLTNRRFIFTGQRRNLEVRHSQLAALEFNPATLLLRKAGRTKTIYFNVAAGYAMVLGTIARNLLAHDDWERFDGGPFPVLVHGGSPHTMENVVSGLLAKPEAMPAVYATFLVLVMNADGTVTDEELSAVHAMDAAVPHVYEEVANYLDGLGLDLADAVDAALQWPSKAREDLFSLCEQLADADGRSEEEQEALDSIRVVLQLDA